jgi:hypothetical protein
MSNEILEMNNQRVELNSFIKSSQYTNGAVKVDSPIVEVFSHMTAGKDLSALQGKLKNPRTGDMVNIDSTVNIIKRLAYEAGGGNGYAVTELNEIRAFAIQPLLLEELKLLGFMGNYTSVGYGDTIFRTLPKFTGQKSRYQANNGDTVFSALEFDKYPVMTTTVSGGYRVDYRKIQFGDMSLENIGMEQTRVDIRNKAHRYVLYVIYDAVNNTTNPHFVAQGAGITQTALDRIINNVRRMGQPNIFGDFSMVSQLNAFHGYQGTVAVVNGVSQEALNEIQRTGLVATYKGSLVHDIKNGFDYTRPLADGSGFEVYFPENLLFVVPSGMQSPIASWTRGGLTSCQAIDVQSGTNVVRFDLEIAADVAKTHEFKIGMFTDTAIAPAPSDPRTI